MKIKRQMPNTQETVKMTKDLDGANKVIATSSLIIFVV